MAFSPPVVRIREPIRGPRARADPTTDPDRLTLAYLYGTWHVTHSTLPMWRGKQNVRITYGPIRPSVPETPRKSSNPYPTETVKTTLAERIASEEAEDEERSKKLLEGKPEPILLDDQVEYQPLGSSKKSVKLIHGTDTAIGGNDSKDERAERLRLWQWRGRGLLFLVTSQWQILGFGEEPLRGDGTDRPKRDKLPKVSIGNKALEKKAPEEEKELPEETNRWMVTFFEKTFFTPAGLDIYSRDARGLSEECVDRIKEVLGGLKDGEVRNLAGSLFEVAMDFVGGGEEDA
ncbi:MAG: hypothetical protein M1823_000976 [Watsoniomyces obsoletus]|nr:MAG: hypothetical protein M1823_000976 [Watsoniomyces obsoletus]